MWEYQVFDYDVGDLEHILNTEGNDGWELAFIIPTYTGTIPERVRIWSETGTAILKRLAMPNMGPTEWDFDAFEKELAEVDDLKDMVLE
jgi:hypothetical protein